MFFPKDVRNHLVSGSSGKDWRLGNTNPAHIVHLSRSRPSRIQQHLPGSFLIASRSRSSSGSTSVPVTYFNHLRIVLYNRHTHTHTHSREYLLIIWCVCVCVGECVLRTCPSDVEQSFLLISAGNLVLVLSS